jgi:hypothetical protein
MPTYPLQRRINRNSSQVTKGKRMFVELGDGRTAWAKRWSERNSTKDPFEIARGQ